MEREEVLEICGVHGKSLLDIGAGPLALIAAKRHGCRVTCIDVDQVALERLSKEVVREGLEKMITLERADAADLPYPDSSFDLVISYGALHHTPEARRKSFLLETFRVAAGRLCVLEYRMSAFPQDEHEFGKVDIEWLENILHGLGRTEKRLGKEMDLYMCFKRN